MIWRAGNDVFLTRRQYEDIRSGVCALAAPTIVFLIEILAPCIKPTPIVIVVWSLVGWILFFVSHLKADGGEPLEFSRGIDLFLRNARLRIEVAVIFRWKFDIVL